MLDEKKWSADTFVRHPIETFRAGGPKTSDIPYLAGMRRLRVVVLNMLRRSPSLS